MGMEGWEFLLQKEGDREWLSLESAHVEVLEGCYRLMARCPHPDSSIHIEINHYFDQAGLTKHRQQRRTHRASASGLLGVIPFTYLEPGLWELQCGLHPTINAAIHNVQLKLEVLPQLVDTTWDWEPEHPTAEAEIAASNASTAANGSDPPDSLSLLRESSQVTPSPEKLRIVAVNAEFATPVQKPCPPLSPTELMPSSQPSPLLVLDQAAHTVFADEAVIITGQAFTTGTLTIRLRNPLTQEITFEQALAVAGAVPQRFSCGLVVPQANCVLVGEARLVPEVQEPSYGFRSSQAFMITVLLPPDLELLNQVLPHSGPNAVLKQPVAMSQPEPLGESQPLLAPVPLAIAVETKELFPSLSPSVMPPRLYPEPTLPVLAAVALATVPSPGLVIPPRLGHPSASKATLQKIQLPHFCQTTPEPVAPTPVVAPSPAARPRSFSSLKRQARFLTTLSQLAVENYPLTTGAAPSPTTVTLAPPPPAPLAAPILTLPETSLQAGTLFSLNLEVPEYHPGIGVKLWVTNAETGDLIAGPRWLTGFTPASTTAGACTQLDLAIPATVEVMALMAIAVDEHTGRESSTVVMRQALTPSA